jgi:hypothetical protein
MVVEKLLETKMSLHASTVFQEEQKRSYLIFSVATALLSICTVLNISVCSQYEENMNSCRDEEYLHMYTPHP